MPLKNGSPLPPLGGATEWINSEIGADDLEGTPSLIYFWAISCEICKRNIPRLQQWQERYGDGLQFVGVHTPRQESDLDVDAVRNAVAEFGVPGTIAIDNSHAVTEAFENQFWPAYFLFDAEGRLRARTAGDVALSMMEKTLERVLGRNSQ